jgi:hypothetical protein
MRVQFGRQLALKKLETEVGLIVLLFTHSLDYEINLTVYCSSAKAISGPSALNEALPHTNDLHGYLDYELAPHVRNTGTKNTYFSCP